MRRTIARLSLIVLVLLAQGPSVYSDEGSGLYGQIGNVGGVGYFGRYISLETGVGWRGGSVTLAAIPRLIVGASQFDSHVAPQALLQFGRVYLQLGWAFELVDRTSTYQVIDSGPSAALGIRTPLLSLAGGTLVLDSGYEVFLAIDPDTDIPLASNLVPNNALEDLLDIATAISAPFSLFRIGLLYTIHP